jgi:chromosome segregation ATPase
VRTLEEEANDEKAVTRHVLEQSIRNGDNLLALRSEVASFRIDLHALTSRMDHVAGYVIQGNATLNNHGRRLNTLTLDVAELRNETTALRRDIGVLQENVTAVRVRLDGTDAKLDRMDARLDRMDARLDGTDTRLDRMDARLDGTDAKLDRMDAKLDAALTAIRALAPRG